MESQISAEKHSSSPPSSIEIARDINLEPKDQKTTPIDFESTLLTLPQDYGWVGDLTYYQYQGFWYPAHFLKGVISVSELDNTPHLFEFLSSDIIICSCMKTGTTWLKSLAFSIFTRTRYDYLNGTALTNNNLTANSTSSSLPQNKTTNPLLKWVSHDLIPTLEVEIVQNQKPRDPDLPLFSTHMPYTSLPRSITTRGCKMIYIWRDPKDTFISTWHFINKFISTLPAGEDKPISLEKAFHLFSRGMSGCCPYWDHVLGYWKASQDYPDQVLILKYEDMMRDTSFSYVKKIAAFMACPFSKEEESQGVVEKIGNFCSFESLNQLDVNKTGKHRADDPFPSRNSTFFRKGKVEDWKNYLTLDMARKLDAITREKFANTGLVF